MEGQSSGTLCLSAGSKHTAAAAADSSQVAIFSQDKKERGGGGGRGLSILVGGVGGDSTPPE